MRKPPPSTEVKLKIQKKINFYANILIAVIVITPFALYGYDEYKIAKKIELSQERFLNHTNVNMSHENKILLAEQICEKMYHEPEWQNDNGRCAKALEEKYIINESGE